MEAVIENHYFREYRQNQLAWGGIEVQRKKGKKVVTFKGLMKLKLTL